MEITIDIPKGIDINDFINNSYLCISGDIPNNLNINDIIESVSIEPTIENPNLKDFEAKKKILINEYSQKFDNLENRNMNRYTFVKKYMKLKVERAEKIDELKNKYNIE